MKKTISVLLAISLLLSFASCGKGKDEEKRSKDVQACENNIKSIKASVEQFRTLNGYDVTKLEEVAAMFKDGRIPKCPVGGAYFIEISSDGTILVECPNCNKEKHNPQNSIKVSTPLKSETGAESLADDVVVETVTNEEGTVVEIQTSKAPNATTQNTTTPNNGGSSQGSTVVGLSKADAVKLLNDATAKAAGKSYDWKRNCSYTRAVDVGNATSTLNSVIKSVNAEADLNSVVGGFIGIGEKSGKASNGRLTTSNGEAVDNKYCLKAMYLTEGDVTSVSNSSNVYTLKLINCTNPQKYNNNALHHVTNDFITHNEVDSGIKDALGGSGAIAITGSNVTFSNIKVVATIVNGELKSLEISYDFDATLNLKAAVLPITGTGAAQTKIVYSNFK